MKRFLIFIFTVICLSWYAAYADNSNRDINSTLDNLEKKMSGIESIQTDFVQEKDLALFNEKLILKGKVFIKKPMLLSWRVFTPMRYSIVIRGSTISQWDEDTNKVQQVSMASNPSFQAAIAQMQNWFSGAYKSMQSDYEITLIKDNPLALVFIPKAGSLPQNFIKRVEIVFQDDLRYLKEISISEKNGDHTRLKFMNTEINQPIDAKTWEAKSSVR
ncbi:MAG: outer membrane lipoprotein carrier protein LolA [Candidatus Omnitrophica bacterium]|nr:outer membrane lipoprotein carrier protein LolA [Candidatus Omnitrophota bacterium]